MDGLDRTMSRLASEAKAVITRQPMTLMRWLHQPCPLAGSNLYKQNGLVGGRTKAVRHNFGHVPS